MSAPGKLVPSSRLKLGPSKGQRPLGSECCVTSGDSGREAYTAIAWGVGLSPERSDIAGAEGFHSLEGNMGGTVMRGAVALLGSKATSRAKGSHRNLGARVWPSPCMLREYGGPRREGEEPKPMMHGHEKSDLVIVAIEPANKARKTHCGDICGGGRSGVGGAKGGAKGNTDQQSTYWTLTQARVSKALERIMCRHRPGVVWGKPHVQIWVGGVR